MAGPADAAGVPVGQRWRDQQWRHYRMDGGSHGGGNTVATPGPPHPASGIYRGGTAADLSVGAYFDGGHLWYKTAGIYR